MPTRPQVLQRAATIWTPGTVPYSQSTIHQPDGYRQDCSGYVSMCWQLPLVAPGSWGGQNTVTLVTLGYMAEIPADQLQPGDAIGLCGPGTAGNAGHIQLFEGWTETGLTIWEQAGGAPGPTRRTLKRIPAGYKAYRYVGISEGDVDMTPEEYDKLLTTVRLAEAKANNAGAVAFALAAGQDSTDQCVIAWGDDLGKPLGIVDLKPYWQRVGGGSGGGGPVDLTPAAYDEIEARALKAVQQAEDE